MRERIKKAVSLLVAMVLIVSNVLPATSLGIEDSCSMVEHSHAAECYAQEKELICGAEATEGHSHGNECYIENTKQLCQLEVTEGHKHEENCYTQAAKLNCGLEETTGHVHETGCYTAVTSQICTLEETVGHVHAETCYQEIETLNCGIEDEAHTHATECYVKNMEVGCGIEEGSGKHIHDQAACFKTENVVSCEIEEGTGAHKHNEACYIYEETLTCGKEEIEGHEHEETCFETTQELGCELEEKEGHEHIDSCYEVTEQLICEAEEHKHVAECHALPVETTAETETELLAANEPVEETKAPRDGNAIYIGKFIEKVTLERRAIGADEWTMLAEKVTEKAEGLSVDETDELRFTVEFKIPGGTLAGTTSVDYILPLKSNEAVYQNKEEVVYALDKVTAIGKAVTKTDGTITITFEETYLEANDNGTEIIGTYQFLANANALVYDAENKADIKFLENKEIFPEEILNTTAVILGFEKEVPETDVPESNADESESNAEETESQVVENVVTFEPNEGVQVLVNGVDVTTTNNVAMAENGTIYFTIQVAEGYELVEVKVDGETVITPDETTGEYRIGNIQTDKTIVAITTITVLKSQSMIGEITVTCEEGTVEKGTQLDVKDEIPNLENVNQAIDEKLAEKFEETAALRPFDINLTDEKGKDAEISGEVTVNVALAEPVSKENAEEIGVEVYQVTDAGDAEEVTDITYTEEVNGEETAITGFSFTTADTAPYVFVEKETITVNYLTSEGDTYEIRVTFGPEAEIPVNAQLQVFEIPEGTDAYEEYYQKALQNIEIGENLEFVMARLFDISIIADGQEIQPKAPVEVNVCMTRDRATFSEAAVEEELQYMAVHVDESAEVIEATNEANSEQDKVSFEANGFSPYMIFAVSQTSDAVGKTGVTNVDNVSIRDDHYLTASEIGIIDEKGNEVEILGEENGILSGILSQWYQIQYGDITGYVQKQYIDILEENDGKIEAEVESTDGVVTSFTVEGELPEGATLVVEKSSLTDSEVVSFFNPNDQYLVHSIWAYDISIQVDGEDWQPTDSVIVTVYSSDFVVNDNEVFGVIHVTENIDRLNERYVELQDQGFSYEATGFSPYVFFTVDTEILGGERVYGTNWMNLGADFFNYWEQFIDEEAEDEE